MTSTLPRRLLQLLLGGVAAFSLVVPSSAEELRIGYVAPITGIFAQVGKDMIDGFQLYLDEVNSDFGGAKVKFSRPPAAASFVKISPPFHHNGAGIERDDLRRRGDTECRQLY